jgi:uncharacterized membrane protein
MTEVAAPPAPPSSRAEGFVAAGTAIVFLLAVAGLLNAALSGHPLPPTLRTVTAQAHLASILIALPLGISQLLLPKGTLRHRTAGYVWIALMVFTALASFGVHAINPGGFSPIHLLSILTLVLCPVIVLQARRGQVAKHRRAVLGLMTGGLVIAGLLTFLAGRALGQLVMRLFGH